MKDALVGLWKTKVAGIEAEDVDWEMTKVARIEVKDGLVGLLMTCAGE